MELERTLHATRLEQNGNRKEWILRWGLFAVDGRSRDRGEPVALRERAVALGLIQ